jgi:exopolyphosphatase/guanosine-5'-triphosphate,3'-diphosphate pyrophosphatase
MTAAETHPSESYGRVVAFMDVGTNSVRIMIVRINPNHSTTVISKQKEAIRLGEGEFDDGNLPGENIDRAVLVCARLADMARANGAEEILVAATSATREAKNQTEILNRLYHEAGLDVRPVSGREEARLIYLGISRSANLNREKTVFVDIGGGSTEIIVGDQDQYEFLDSLKLGAIRLTGIFFDEHDTGPVKASAYDMIRRYVSNVAVHAMTRAQKHEYTLAYGSSGTIENLADIAIEMKEGRRRRKEDVLTRSDLREVAKKLCSVGLEERRRIPGINPNRADLIIAGAAILETLMDGLGIDALRVSGRGLKDGLLVDYLARHDHDLHVIPMSARERSVLQLGRSCRFDEKHSRHVASLAQQIFDCLRKEKLHRLGPVERELLGHAGLLHDVGKFLSYENHARHTYYIIRNADLVAFDQMEIALMATVGLYHRRKLPKQRHPEFAALHKKAQKATRFMAMCLRMAESLDRGHASTVQRVSAKRKKDHLRLTLHTVRDSQLEEWGIQQHVRAFEKVFGLPLRVRVERAENEEGAAA